MNSPQSFYRYLPTDSMDRDWGIYATSAGFVDIAPGMTYPPPGHPKDYAFLWDKGRQLDEIQVHLILRGSGVFESGMGTRRKHSIEPGCVFVLFPQVWHRYRPRESTGWLEYWIGFKGEALNHIMSKHFFSPTKSIFNLTDATPILNLFTEVITQLRVHPPGVSRIIGSLDLNIMAKVHASVATPQPLKNRTETIVSESRLMLGQHLEHDLELELLAQKLGVGYHWLRRLFKQQTGISMNQYRLQVRVNRAKQLLTETDLTVGQIAATTGFENGYYFSQLFKSKAGCAPTRWRTSSRSDS